MKKPLLLILLFFISFSISAQQRKNDFSKEINEQLWEKFVLSYNTRDTEKYLSVHSKDIVRITQIGIRQGDVFRDGIRKAFARKNQPQRRIEFKHEHRIHEEDIAYEVGYFKVTYTRDGEEEDFYGRFSVLLKKEDGQWKIAQDWDVDKINGEPISERDYDRLKSPIISQE